MTWKKTDERIVGFMDIMGFKKMVSEEDHVTTYNKLRKISKAIKGIDKLNTENLTLKTVIFSDTIVIFSERNSFSDFLAVGWAMSTIFDVCIKASVPIKGAISTGKFSYDEELSIFFGEPLINAYNLEEELCQYSIIIHNSIEKLFKRILEKKENKGLLFEFSTPMKSGKITHKHFNSFLLLLYQKSIGGDDEIDISSILKNLNEKTKQLYLNVSGSSRVYIDNTLVFLEEIEKYLESLSQQKLIKTILLTG